MTLHSVQTHDGSTELGTIDDETWQASHPLLQEMADCRKRNGRPLAGYDNGYVKVVSPVGPVADARLDVTGQIVVEGAFDNKELRDPKTGKWIKDPAGHYLDEALKEVGHGKMMSHNGHEVDRSAKGFNVRFYKREGGKKVKVGEGKTYSHPGDAAEALRRGRHLNTAELKFNQGHLKPEGPKVPKTGRPKVGDAVYYRDGKGNYQQGLIEGYDGDTAIVRRQSTNRTHRVPVGDLNKGDKPKDALPMPESKPPQPKPVDLSKDIREFQRGDSEPSPVLLDAVMKAGPDAPEMYRGLVDKHGDQAKIDRLNAISTARPGTVLDGGGAVTSWSPDKNVADDFAGVVSPGGPDMRGGQTGVVLRMEPGAHALSVGGLGQPGYAHQKEWLARPGNLEVVSNDPHPTVKGLRVVTVRETSKQPKAAPEVPKAEPGGAAEEVKNLNAELYQLRLRSKSKVPSVAQKAEQRKGEIEKRMRELGAEPKGGRGQETWSLPKAGPGGGLKMKTEPKLPDGYTLHPVSDGSGVQMVRFNGETAGALYPDGPGGAPYEWYLPGKNGKPNQRGPASSEADGVTKLAEAHKASLAKPKRGPAKDISMLSAAPPKPGYMSPLESHFVAEYREDASNANGFKVNDRDELNTVLHLEMYAKVPEGSRRYLAQAGAEIHFGTRPVSELDHLSSLAKDRPHGYAEGQTFGKVAAVVTHHWDPKEKRMKSTVAIGGGSRTYGSGSRNVSAHEAAHALDFSSGHASQQPEFNDIYKSVADTFKIDPYYVQKDGPTGQGAREFFAEAYAAWAEERARVSRAALSASAFIRIMNAVGARGGTHKATLRSLRSGGTDMTAADTAMQVLGEKLVKYFDAYQARIDGMAG